MASIGLWAVVFDLDDTLYSEREYVRSGFNAVSAAAPEIDGMAEKLWSAFEAGEPAIDAVLKREGFEELKDGCLKAYREQMPDIHLYTGAMELIQSLHDKGIKVGILTDGRPEGQRNKLTALGLEEVVDEIVVTDELGGAEYRKPNEAGFRVIQQKLNVPFLSMVYVGDNLKKDFIAPKALGMKTLWFNNSNGLYCKDGTQSFLDIIAALNEVAGNGVE